MRGAKSPFFLALGNRELLWVINPKRPLGESGDQRGVQIFIERG